MWACMWFQKTQPILLPDVFLSENSTGIKCIGVCIFGCRLVQSSAQTSLFRARKDGIFLGSGLLFHYCTSTQVLEVKNSHMWTELPPWTNERRCRPRKDIPGPAGCSVSCPLTWVALLERTQVSCSGQEWNPWVGWRRPLSRGSSIFILVFFWFLKWCWRYSFWLDEEMFGKSFWFEYILEVLKVWNKY